MQGDAGHQPLPLQVLLLALPTILAVPPNHPLHLAALKTSVLALRCCVALNNLAPDEECQAWLMLADLGLRVLRSGLHRQSGPQWRWVEGIEYDTEAAIGKGLMICEKHANLRVYKIHLLLANARFATWQRNFKLVRTQLKRAADTIYPTDPSYLYYTCQLAQIELSTSQPQPDIPQAFHHIDMMRATADKLGDTMIPILAVIVKLKVLVDNEHWTFVPATLAEAGKLLHIECLQDPTMELTAPGPKKYPHPLQGAMAVHALMYGIVYFTHMGHARESGSILTVLHALLDDGVLHRFPDGALSLPLQIGPPLRFEVPHPDVILLGGFLLSCVSKRDCVGRKPKRKAFAQAAFQHEADSGHADQKFPVWSDLHSVQVARGTFIELQADVMCELVALSILRSEFEVAETQLNELIEFLRLHDLFPQFAARVSLHHAHLAHALGVIPRAKTCYQVAAHLAGESTWVWAVAVAGEIGLDVGIGGSQEEREVPDKLREWCQSSGGNLQMLLRVIDACQVKEIVKAKQHLRAALDSATVSLDNHLRALVLALTSAIYFHTAEEHAHKMLQTCRQLAAGIGAPDRRQDNEDSQVHGNAVLGLWVGQKFIELYNRQGRSAKAAKQIELNNQFMDIMKLQSQFAATLTRGS